MSQAANFQPGMWEFRDDDGSPLALGTIETYLTGTLTPQAIYSDVGLTTPLANPFTLDSAGRLVAFMADVAYRVIVKRANGTTVKDIPNVHAALPGTASSGITDLDRLTVLSR